MEYFKINTRERLDAFSRSVHEGFRNILEGNGWFAHTLMRSRPHRTVERLLFFKAVVAPFQERQPDDFVDSKDKNEEAEDAKERYGRVGCEHLEKAAEARRAMLAAKKAQATSQSEDKASA